MIKFLDRKNTFSKKWDIPSAADDTLGLWIADMDFQCPSCVLDALAEFNNFGIYGYYDIKESYYDAFINWQKNNHDAQVKREWIHFSPGVVPALYWIVDAFTKENESVMLSSPVYFPFFTAIKDNKRNLVVHKLSQSSSGYQFDLADFEKQIVSNNVKLYIFCNPHNPIGKVWEEELILKMMDICKKHQVRIISDEIHQDFTYGDHVHKSMIRYWERYDEIFVLTSGGKSFNIATFKNAFVVIPKKENFARYDEKVKLVHFEMGNIMGYLGTEAAYREGKPWLDEVKSLIYDNYLYIKNALQGYPELVIPNLEGTYLLWIKLEKAVAPAEVSAFLKNECRIAINDGEWFGGTDYQGYFRVNLATSREVIEEFVKRMSEALDKRRN
ncbi:MAG: PatB family C-S lyase [Peptostreptococcaceae bacterium]|nr:PatB family C-S lyase [Peptostreptococcaceae bacterium]